MKRIDSGRTPGIFLAALAVAALVAAPAAAQVAQVAMTGEMIAFEPQVDFAGLTLTVSGGAFWQRFEYGPGESPAFTIFDSAGQRLPDGSYAWELVVTPEVAFSAADLAARDAGAPVAVPRQVQSGYFRIANGALVSPAAEGGRAETPAAGGPSTSRGGDGMTEDQVILDDLIVDGSACIGQDCVNGESFGFDTVRLKENNLRIKFQDTSNSASFPTNDWQITANDSSNGGANKFSIDDIDGGRTPFTLEAGAPSHSLYVDDGGRIGFGTSTPVVELHVKDGDTPTLRLEQDGSSGFTPQTWDVAGNEANFFVRDATNGSKLVLKLKPNSPTSSIFVEGTSGDVGMQEESPDAALHVKRTSGGFQSMLKLENTSGGVALEFEHTGTDTWDLRNAGGYFAINLVGSANNDDFRILNAGGANLQAGNFTLVNGDFITESNTYADFVFEEDYPLRSLDELAAFIEREKHLPDIPTEAEVKAGGGLRLGEMNVLLLQKVEELTLYTLQQHNTIAELSARLEELESQE